MLREKYNIVNGRRETRASKRRADAYRARSDGFQINTSSSNNSSTTTAKQKEVHNAVISKVDLKPRRGLLRSSRIVKREIKEKSSDRSSCGNLPITDNGGDYFSESCSPLSPRSTSTIGYDDTKHSEDRPQPVVKNQIIGCHRIFDVALTELPIYCLPPKKRKTWLNYTYDHFDYVNRPRNYEIVTERGNGDCGYTVTNDVSKSVCVNSVSNTNSVSITNGNNFPSTDTSNSVSATNTSNSVNTTNSTYFSIGGVCRPSNQVELGRHNSASNTCSDSNNYRNNELLNSQNQIADNLANSQNQIADNLATSQNQIDDNLANSQNQIADNLANSQELLNGTLISKQELLEDKLINKQELLDDKLISKQELVVNKVIKQELQDDKFISKPDLVEDKLADELKYQVDNVAINQKSQVEESVNNQNCCASLNCTVTNAGIIKIEPNGISSACKTNGTEEPSTTVVYGTNSTNDSNSKAHTTNRNSNIDTCDSSQLKVQHKEKDSVASRNHEVAQLHLLRQFQVVSSYDEDGDWPIHIAVVQGDETVVRRILSLMSILRLNVDIYNNLRQTPLHLAIITKSEIIVATLLQFGASPVVQNKQGHNGLHLAVKYGFGNALSLQLAKDTSAVNILDFEGLSPLHLAVQLNRQDLVDILLQAGADVDLVDGKSGRSALFYAVESNSEKIASILLDAKANVQLMNYAGIQPIGAALGRGYSKMVELLIYYGAESISIKDKETASIKDTILIKDKDITEKLPTRMSPQSHLMSLMPSPGKRRPAKETLGKKRLS